MSRGIQYSKEAVRIALNVLDQEGVSRRKSRRLKRRKYCNKGPNHVWHMDGNDKLRPFGFYVHGCIDGFSRKIIWLHVANTNKDPAVIAYYFLKEVKVISGTATKIRADLGSENSYVYGIQMFFGRNDLRDCGQSDDTDNVHVEALKFSFYGVIQNDLDSLSDY